MWTRADIEKLAQKGMVAKKDIPKKPTPAGMSHIKEVLTSQNINFVEEHKFSPNRKFRFDIYLTDLNIGIEYEGLMSEKSRHTTIEGYSKDAEKYNLAACMGIFVLRYTALNFNQFENDINKINGRL